MSIKREDALNYHTQGQPGKIEVVPTKMLSSQLDLALAYSCRCWCFHQQHKSNETLLVVGHKTNNGKTSVE